MFTEYRMHLISTVCIFRTTEKKLCPRRFPAQYVRISWFVNSGFLSLWKAHSLKAPGKGLLHSALLRCGTLGKTAHCLFCGDWQQSSLGWLKPKWKNTSWVIFPLPTLTESVSECIVTEFRSSYWSELLCLPNQRCFWRLSIGRAPAANYRSSTCCSSRLLAIPLKRLYSWRLQNQLLITTFYYELVAFVTESFNKYLLSAYYVARQDYLTAEIKNWTQF